MTPLFKNIPFLPLLLVAVFSLNRVNGEEIQSPPPPNNSADDNGLEENDDDEKLEKELAEEVETVGKGDFLEPLPIPEFFLDEERNIPIITTLEPPEHLVEKQSKAPLKYEVIAEISDAPTDYFETAKKLKEVVESPDLYGVLVGVYVERIKDGRKLFSYNGRLPLNPASNVKVITSAAALSLLGPSHRFKTEIYFDKEPDDKGWVRGNMYVKGYGDPSLVSERLWLLVTELRNRGVAGITGNLIVDNSYFGGAKNNPGWKSEPKRTDAYKALYDAFSVNFNAVGITILPGEKSSGKPRVFLEPEIPYLIVDNQVQNWGRRYSKLSIATEPQGQKTKIVIKGRVGTRFEKTNVYRMIYHPELFAAETLKEYMELKGIRIKGKIRTGMVPKNLKEFYKFTSPPLSEILKKVNKYSSNFTAEQLVKILGAYVYEPPGDWEKGIRVLKEFLDIVGIEPDEYLIDNGSGLSENARVSPHSLVKVLSYLYSQDYIKPEYLSSLSIAGADGTLSGRLANIPRGAIRAKTGTLDNVSALSGYAIAANGEHLAFSIILNKPRGQKLDMQLASKILDSIGEALVSPPVKTQMHSSLIE